MICRICEWLGKKFLADVWLDKSSFWKASRKWERDHSNEWDLWEGESEAHRTQMGEASDILSSDPSASFAICCSLADKGVVWSMEMTGRYYEFGTGVSADLAQTQEYYSRAFRAGSQMALLKYASTLKRHGDLRGNGVSETWLQILEEGVEAKFVPAYFWLAWYRYELNKRNKTARSVRHLLEYAAEADHPGARLMLARWTMTGKFGFRHMRRGSRMVRDVTRKFIAAQSEARQQVD